MITLYYQIHEYIKFALESNRQKEKKKRKRKIRKKDKMRKEEKRKN